MQPILCSQAGWSWSCSCWLTPQPQKCWIRVTSATYTAVPSNAGSLTHRARPGVKPASSWLLVQLVTAEPQWELPADVFLKRQGHLRFHPGAQRGATSPGRGGGGVIFSVLSHSQCCPEVPSAGPHIFGVFLKGQSGHKMWAEDLANAINTTEVTHSPSRNKTSSCFSRTFLFLVFQQRVPFRLFQSFLEVGDAHFQAGPVSLLRGGHLFFWRGAFCHFLGRSRSIWRFPG